MSQDHGHPETPKSLPGFVEMGIIAIGVALTLALLEGVLSVAVRAPDEITWSNRLQFIFPRQLISATVVGLTLMIVVWLGVTIAGWVLKWKAWPIALFFLLMFLLIFDLLDCMQYLRLRSSAVLAFGLAFQMSRWFARHPITFRQWGQRLTGAQAILVVVLAGGSLAMAQWRERNATSQLPPAPSEAPSVLLIVADTLRADALSSYGNPLKATPFIDSLAARGVLFERAYAASSWTLPSHASLMTGRHPFEHTIRSSWGEIRVMDPRHSTLAEAFQSAGYVTGGFAANPWYCAPHQGFSRGFLRYKDNSSRFEAFLRRTAIGKRVEQYVLPRLGWHHNTDAQSSEEINQGFLRWLDGVNDRPFFAFLNYMDPHGPLFPPLEFAAKFSRDPQKLVKRKPLNFLTISRGEATPEMQRMELEAYAASVAHLDAKIAELLGELERRGLARNLIVIFTADHGEAFGEQGLYGHRVALYKSMIHVPLLIRFDGVVPAGVRVAEPVSHQALAATIMELARLPVANPFPGPSLAGAWTPGASEASGWTPGPVLVEVDGAKFGGGPAHWPVRKGWLKSLIAGQWQFILREDGHVELYDLVNAPDMPRNLAELPENKAIVESMWQHLEALVPEARSARAATASH